MGNLSVASLLVVGLLMTTAFAHPAKVGQKNQSAHHGHESVEETGRPSNKNNRPAVMEAMKGSRPGLNQTHWKVNSKRPTVIIPTRANHQKKNPAVMGGQKDSQKIGIKGEHHKTHAARGRPTRRSAIPAEKPSGLIQETNRNRNTNNKEKIIRPAVQRKTVA